MNKYQNIYLCCDDNAEMVVFTKYNLEDNGVDYEISIKDSYCDGDYKGIKGRFKRAWKAFWAKPVYYTSVYCEDEEHMRKFLNNCLNIMNNEDDN
jgi:hypothetical protein